MQEVDTAPEAGATRSAVPPERSVRAGAGVAARRAGLAVLAGVALLLGHPPVGWSLTGLVALAPMIALARDVAGSQRPVRAGVGWGFVAGVAFFAPLVEWVRLVDVVAAGLLVLIQAAFVAAYVAGLAWWGRRPGWLLMAPLLWVALEALRGSVPFGGFAWGILGYTQHDGPFLLVARTLGVLGVSLVLAAVAAGVEETVHRLARRPAGGGGRNLLLPAAGTGAVLLAGGLLTLVSAPDAEPRSVDIAAVQGFDVEGSTGRSAPRAVRIADGHAGLTRRLASSPAGPPELLVWPENAIDSEPARHPELAERIQDALEAAGGAPLLTGVITRGPTEDTWRNTMAVFAGSATQPVAEYVKRQPVPFGEYIPFRSLIGWYPAVRRLRPTDAAAGTEVGVLDTGLDGVRVGAVICFESIFPRLVHSQVREGANVLVVATNNSSFGRSAMSDQHLAFSSLRAVETGRWVVHAALTGKSALVDPDGRVSQETDLFEQAVVRGDVPLVEGRTLATAVGDGVGWLALALTGAAFAGGWWRRRDASP